MTVLQLRPSRRDVVKGTGSALVTALSGPAYAKSSIRESRSTSSSAPTPAAAMMLARGFWRGIGRIHSGQPLGHRPKHARGRQPERHELCRKCCTEGRADSRRTSEPIGYEPMMGLSGGVRMHVSTPSNSTGWDP